MLKNLVRSMALVQLVELIQHAYPLVIVNSWDCLLISQSNTTNCVLKLVL